MIGRDPLDHYAQFEQYLLSPSAGNRSAFTDAIRCELPQEIYLEIASWYAGLDDWADAEDVLRLAPSHPMVDYWLGYVESRLGRVTESRDHLRSALGASPMLVFPHRREEMEVLRWAEGEQPHWKNRYYIALLSWSLGKPDEAREWLDACGGTPAYAPFYITRASLPGAGPDRALADYWRALKAGPDEWRTHNAIITFLNERGRFDVALPLCLEAARKFRGSYIMQFLLARTLLFSRQYAASLAILDTLTILPFEGARYGRDAYRHACILAALQKTRTRESTAALSLIGRARLWPERLGAGKPYDADTRIEDYLESGVRRKAGETARADELLSGIVRYTRAHMSIWNAQHLIGAFALRDLGKQAEGMELLEQWYARDPGSDGARWALMVYRGDTKEAHALEEGLASSILNRSSGDQDFVLTADVVSTGSGR
jgi:tetratricopeptide (TPR) repeat protein